MILDKPKGVSKGPQGPTRNSANAQGLVFLCHWALKAPVNDGPQHLTNKQTDPWPIVDTVTEITAETHAAAWQEKVSVNRSFIF